MAADTLAFPPKLYELMENSSGDQYVQAIKVGDEFWVVGSNNNGYIRVWRDHNNTTWQHYDIDYAPGSAYRNSGMLASDGTNIFMAYVITETRNLQPCIDGYPLKTVHSQFLRVMMYDPVVDGWFRINVPAPPAIGDPGQGSANDSSTGTFPFIACNPEQPGRCAVVWSDQGIHNVGYACPTADMRYAEGVHVFYGGDFRTLGYGFTMPLSEGGADFDKATNYPSQWMDGDAASHSGRINATIVWDGPTESPKVVGAQYTQRSPDILDTKWHVYDLISQLEIDTIDTSQLTPVPTTIQSTWKPYYQSFSKRFTKSGQDYRYLYAPSGVSGLPHILINEIPADFTGPPVPFDGDAAQSDIIGTYAGADPRPFPMRVAGKEVWLPVRYQSLELYEYDFANTTWIDTWYNFSTGGDWVSSVHSWLWDETEGRLFLVGNLAGANWSTDRNKWAILEFDYSHIIAGLVHLESEPVLMVGP